MEEAESLCDRLAIVDHGKVIASGTLAELRSLLAEHAETTARAPGCTRCVAYALLGGEPGEYALVAWWSDEASLRAHYGSSEYGLYASAVGELLARPSDVQIDYVDRTVRARGDASLDPTRQG
jgi:quinol monooxygenase YgiN